jgi:Tol biopolymer transport system component
MWRVASRPGLCRQALVLAAAVIAATAAPVPAFSVGDTTPPAHRDGCRWPGTVCRVTVASDGTQGDFASGPGRLSATGRYVVFTSRATNLVPGDTNAAADVFVRDRQHGVTTRVSVGTGGAQAEPPSTEYGGPSISADGRFVLFGSSAANLVPGDTNGVSDVFVHDRKTGTTSRVSVTSDGEQGRGHSSPWPGGLSADGRYVVFGSRAWNLVPGDTNRAGDVFRHDRRTGTTSRLSAGAGGTPADGESGAGVISGDGRFVTFQSEATNLVAGDANGKRDAFVVDTLTHATTRVSVSSGGAQANSVSDQPEISADGRLVVFSSPASNLVPGDTNDTWDVFVHDRHTGLTSLGSVASGGTQANRHSEQPEISADGRYIAFVTRANNLGPTDTNETWDVYVRDRSAGTTSRLSVPPGGPEPGRSVSGPMISGDGRVFGFLSELSSFVAGDTNGVNDVFVTRPRPSATPRVFALSVEGCVTSGDAGVADGCWGTEVV